MVGNNVNDSYDSRFGDCFQMTLYLVWGVLVDFLEICTQVKSVGIEYKRYNYSCLFNRLKYIVSIVTAVTKANPSDTGILIQMPFNPKC